jgi:hypothetical protein
MVDHENPVFHCGISAQNDADCQALWHFTCITILPLVNGDLICTIFGADKQIRVRYRRAIQPVHANTANNQRPSPSAPQSINSLSLSG